MARTTMTIDDLRRMLKESNGGDLVAWQDTIEIDTTPGAVYDAILRYRFTNYFSPNHIGDTAHRLGWSSVPPRGALRRLIDAYPIDGQVEIDFYPVGETGFRVKVRAVWRHSAHRPLKQVEVTPYAKELATVIRGLIVQPTTPDGLTDRERETATLLASGARRGEIAAVMGISPATVDGYKKSIRQKWELDDAHDETIANEARKRGYKTGES